MTKLTAKQQAFINEYVVDKNATQSAIRAGYSEKTAHVIGPENLVKPGIKDAIDKKLIKLAERTELNAEAVIRGLHLNATTAYEAEQYNASVSARDKLGKHFGIYEEDNTQKKPEVNINTMTDEQLLKLVSGGQA